METRGKIGVVLGFIFSLISFIIGLYGIFSTNNLLATKPMGWLTAGLLLASLILSLSLFATKAYRPRITNLGLIIVAMLLVIHFDIHWLLFCLTISLVGCALSFEAKKKSSVKIGS